MKHKKPDWAKIVLIVFFLCLVGFSLEAARRFAMLKCISYLGYWISEDMEKVALQSNYKFLSFWDTKKGICTNTFPCSSSPFLFAQFSPSGNFFCWLEIHLSTPVVKLFNLQSGRISSIPMEESYILNTDEPKQWQIKWVRDDFCVLICCLKRSPIHCAHALHIFRLNLKNGKLDCKFEDVSAYGSRRFELSESEKCVLSQGELIFRPNRTTLLYNFSPKVYSIPFCTVSHLLDFKKMKTFFGQDPIVANAKWLPGDKTVVLQIETIDSNRWRNSSFLFWDLENDGLQKSESQLRRIKDYFFIDRGDKIIAYGENSSLLVMDTKTKKQELLNGHSAPIKGLLLSLEQGAFVTYDSSGEVIFWDLKNLKPHSKHVMDDKIIEFEKTTGNRIRIRGENKHATEFTWQGELTGWVETEKDYPKRINNIVIEKSTIKGVSLFSLKSISK